MAAKAVRGKMPTSSTEPGSTLLLFVAADGAIERWQHQAGCNVTLGTDVEERPPAAGRAIMIVPGEQVAIHWLELADGLAPAQKAAAARLMLAGSTAEPLEHLHLALGPAEAGRTPAALVSRALMQAWLADGLEPDVIAPSSWLLPAPVQAFARRDRGNIADYRATGAAFSLEPDLAEALIANAPVTTLDEHAFTAGLHDALTGPMLNLRQGEFAVRRRWRLEGTANARRVAWLGIALLLLTLAVQIASILGYTFAADRAEAETRAHPPRAGRGGGHAGLGPPAKAKVDALRAAPQAPRIPRENTP
ncbi:MAG: type II secretion system protein GspL, partial [Sphingosinicella sp.]